VFYFNVISLLNVNVNVSVYPTLLTLNTGAATLV